MKKSFLAVFASATALSLSTVSAKPLSFGYQATQLRTGSEAILSIPFNQITAASGAIAENPVVASELAVVRVAGNPNWIANAFAETHYIRVLDGPLAGRYFTIESNDANSVVVEPLGIDIASLQIGDHYEIARYWTLDSAFPVAGGNGLYASGTDRGILRLVGSIVSIPDAPAKAHRTLTTSDWFFFTEDGGWKQVDRNVPSAGSTILSPDSYVSIWQPWFASNSKVFVSGQVDRSPLTTSFVSSGKDTLANPLALNSPLPVRLGSTSLHVGFKESPSAHSAANGDTLVVYQPNGNSFRAAPYRTYFRNAGQWREVGGKSALANDALIPVGTGLSIVKTKGAVSVTAFSFTPLQ